MGVHDVEHLCDLSGWRLGSVCFVGSYVEFDFDGPVVRSLATPICLIGGRVFLTPSADWREALCRLIGARAESVNDGEDAIRIEFDRGRVEIPKASYGTGAEVAHLMSFHDGCRSASSMSIWENQIPTRDNWTEQPVDPFAGVRPRAEDIESLSDLQGWDLSAVCFGDGQVDFQFDGPVLRSFASAICVVDGTAYSPPGAEWRDALCQLIGTEVQSATDRSDSVRVDVDRGYIEIPKASPDAGAEVARFMPFRPGRSDPPPIIWENQVSRD